MPDGHAEQSRRCLTGTLLLLRSGSGLFAGPGMTSIREREKLRDCGFAPGVA